MTIQLISIPRSGQHFTEAALRYYHELLNIPFSYCEFYNCCKNIPCNKNSNALQKNHDFNLDIEIKDTNKYIFLYRENILQQIDAHFRYQTINQKIFYTNENIIEQFKDFVRSNKNYYINMYNKYLNQNKSNILELEYDNLVTNFNEKFYELLAFLNIEINEEFIEKTKLYIKPLLIYKISKTDEYYNYLNTYIKTEFVNS
jgi:hypothetical protein